MTDHQREIAELLRRLGRPAEIIAASTGLSLEAVKAWLKTGKSLFDAIGAGRQRKAKKPVITLSSNHGLLLFASDTAGRPGTHRDTSARGPC